MKTNAAGLQLMKDFEGLRLEAYLCPAKVPTIGWGNTFYPDGRKVQMGDKITRQEADELLQDILSEFEAGVSRMAPKTLNENQFSALVSFAYNIGLSRLRTSTLLKKVTANPNDPSIRDEFLRWNRAGGQVLAGLTRRRKAEADLYFTNP
jgi:lysozyme